ncbi:hypothetical protein CLU79DRAFT_778023 [Phycomyces nitens]|nr:hypothetical protein CLU79DRAFT_778023 [Phycomyces nitens]
MYLKRTKDSAALDLVDTVIASQKCPLPAILLEIVHCIIRPVAHHNPDEWLAIGQRCHRLLSHVLLMYGSSVFVPIWNTFSNFRIIGDQIGSLTRNMLKREPGYISKRTSKEDEDGEDGVDDMLLGMHEYSDFWDLVAKCTKQGDMANIKIRNARLVLDFLVSVLEQDIYEKKDVGKLGRCIFLMMLKKDGMGARTQLDTYLDTLFLLFEDQEDCEDKSVDMYSLDILGRVMNLLVYLAIDKFVSFPNLSSQTYRHLQRLSIDNINLFLGRILYTSFVHSIACVFLQDTDMTLVPLEHRHYSQNIRGDGVDKLFCYVLKTRPSVVNTIEDVHRHVSAVSWYLGSYITNLSLCYENRPGHLDYVSGLSEEQTMAVFDSGTQAVKNWRKSIEDMIRDLEADPEIQQKVEQIMDLVELDLQII